MSIHLVEIQLGAQVPFKTSGTNETVAEVAAAQYRQPVGLNFERRCHLSRSMKVKHDDRKLARVIGSTINLL